MDKIFLFLSMFCVVVGQLFLKKGITSSSLSPNISSIIKTLLTPLVLSGFFMYGLSSILWLFVLQKFPLSVAYPALSITYVIIVFLSYFFLNEPFSISKIVGIILIMLGVFFLFK